MFRTEFASESVGNGERLAARISTQFLLRSCVDVSKLAAGDLVRGIVVSAILDANVRGLRHHSPESHRLAGLETVPSDDIRKPISVSALARSLGMPYETTRRHVVALIEAGVCVRQGDQGVLVTAEWVAAHKDLTTNSYLQLKSLLSVLYNAGFDLDAMARTPG